MNYSREINNGSGAGWKIFSILIVASLLFLFLFSSSAFAAIYGDINDDGAINVQDVVLVMRHVLGLSGLTTAQEIAADVNADNDIDVVDVTLIMRMSLGLIDKFPALPGMEYSLVREDGFSVYDGLSPGQSLVLVRLVVPDSHNYRVFVAGNELKYGNVEVSGDSESYFYGEVDSSEALPENVKVKSKQ